MEKWITPPEQPAGELEAVARRALRSALPLITDGLATDPPGGLDAGLAVVMAQPAGEAALRLAIAIGCYRHSRLAGGDRAAAVGEPDPDPIAEHDRQAAPGARHQRPPAAGPAGAAGHRLRRRRRDGA